MITPLIKIPRPWRLFMGLILAAMLWPIQPASGQTAYTAHNSFIPMGKDLTMAMVRDELERRMTRNPNNEAALWNTGYDFFRNFPKNQDTARAIKEGFLRARADTREQKQILTKAAIYWEKIHDYGITNVPVGNDPNTRDMTYYGSTAKLSTLPMLKSGDKHRPHRDFSNFDYPGRFLEKRHPYKGRADNPYPGKYYPGMYPP
ncbi:hypothetical protein C4J81_06705 [Deltaproteobacteria bacterium Smac51]|nr:hypothetical protein C4J81_06705 [Deltaproteobacteria bacterium Smac51]